MIPTCGCAVLRRRDRTRSAWIERKMTMNDLISMVYRARDEYEQKIQFCQDSPEMKEDLHSAFVSSFDYRITIDLDRKAIGMETNTGIDLNGDKKWDRCDCSQFVRCLLEIIAASMFPDWPRHWDGDLPAAMLERWNQLKVKEAEWAARQAEAELNARQAEIDRMTHEHLAGVTIEAGGTDPAAVAARVGGFQRVALL